MNFKEIKAFENGHTDSVFCLAVSSSGKLIYSGGADYRIIAWDTDNG